MFIYHQENEMLNCLKKIESFVVRCNGEKTTIKKEDIKFKELHDKVYNLFSNSRVMPAFGVSLNSETQDAIRNDVWIEINFNSEMIINELSFSSLLFKLDQTSGVNLIRQHNGRYEGRCIFLDFDEEMDLIRLFGQIVDF